MTKLGELFDRRRGKFVLKKEIGNKILILSPHADDESIGCGGTILKLLHEGYDITVLLFCHRTDSSRVMEFNKVKDMIGYQNAYYLEQEDGKLLEQTDKVKRMLSNILKKERPHIIFTPYILDQQPDHLAVNKCLQEVLKENDYLNDISIFLYEVWSFIQNPDYFINITDYFKQKKRILLQYESQEKKYGITTISEEINSIRSRLSFRKRYKYVECFKEMNGRDFTEAYVALYGTR